MASEGKCVSLGGGEKESGSEAGATGSDRSSVVRIEKIGSNWTRSLKLVRFRNALAGPGVFGRFDIGINERLAGDHSDMRVVNQCFQILQECGRGFEIGEESFRYP